MTRNSAILLLLLSVLLFVNIGLQLFNMFDQPESYTLNCEWKVPNTQLICHPAEE